MSRPYRCIVAVVVAVAALTPFALARAQTAGSPGPTTTSPTGARIALVAQDPWTPLGGDVRFRLTAANAPDDAIVGFAVYPRLTGRQQFNAAASTGSLGSVLNVITIPLAEIPTESDGTRPVTVGLQSPNAPTDPRRLQFIRLAGVYPMEVSLRDRDGATASSFRTMLVVTEADRPTITEPLQVALVLPVSDVPSRLPNGEVDANVTSAFRINGRLGQLATALRANPDVPVTLSPTGETIEAWNEASKSDPSTQVTFDALLSSLPGRSVLDGTYVPIDLPALLDHGHVEAIDDVFRRGSDALGSMFGSAVDQSTQVMRPASPAALARMRFDGVQRVIVPADALAASAELSRTLAQPVTLTATLFGGVEEEVAALVADPGFQSILTAELPAAQRVQLLLGGLAFVATEAPSNTRVVTLLAPDRFDPPPALYDGLLRGLRNNPYLTPVTVATAFDTVPPDPPPATAGAAPATSDRELVAGSTSAPPVTAVAYKDHRVRLDAYARLVRPGDPTFTDADRSLLSSVATGWPADIGKTRAQAHLKVVDRVIAELLSRIEVPDPRTITLTSRSGEIPLTFRNETGAHIPLRVSLASEKLFFPNGSVVDLVLDRESTTVRVAVEARTSGTFPLELEVTSADGVLSISHRRLEVRSTFVSTVGVVLMASAAGFLALWWGFDLRRRRRRRRASAT